ncbi:ABC transporter substrate-binding protein [Amycolatopsis rhabdoformis]|uniref:ABC transporter substrate-binding protein n=1 Tax=Amycolatopsis rhabdoformis TaxID=1448059 RepID=A0ABZ1ICP6_9PSEU|nr:ABC transporter substrate-binding protein [Amycolatopsis rhabdoformis]WSE31903.1 ABC transporter substrate-binding protein [Amycolatopsis rhabdoformis]
MKLPPLPRTRRLTALLAATVLAATPAACGGGSDAAAPPANGLPTLKLVSYTSGAAAWIGYLGQKKGFFAKDGVNVQLVTLPAGAQATSALLGGSLDVANLDLNNIGPALVQGQKFKLLVNEYVNNWQIISKSADATKPLDSLLSSIKTVGVPSLGGAGTRFVQYLAQLHGGNAQAIKYVVDPNGASQVSGSTDATATDPVGGCVLENQGFKSAFSFLDLKAPKESYPAQVQALIGLPALSYWSSAKWADDNPKAVTAFQQGVKDTIAWVKDPANGDEIASMLANTVWHVSSLPGPAWTACVKSTVKQFDPEFPPAAVDTWNTFVKATGVAPNGLPPASQWLATGAPQQ